MVVGGNVTVDVGKAVVDVNVDSEVVHGKVTVDVNKVVVDIEGDSVGTVHGISAQHGY